MIFNSRYVSATMASNRFAQRIRFSQIDFLEVRSDATVTWNNILRITRSMTGQAMFRDASETESTAVSNAIWFAGLDVATHGPTYGLLSNEGNQKLPLQLPG